VSRTVVVTGAASGIGRATCEVLEEAGDRVIDVDLRGASVIADLATTAGRERLVEEVGRVSGGTLDAVVANAGTIDEPSLCVRVNYFGAVATLEGLRPLLARSSAPRAVVTASSSILNGAEAEIVDLCLAGDEEGAVRAAGRTTLMAYPSSKRAVARWMRRAAPTELWAGAGIGLNAVAPGVIHTPMSEPLLADEDMRALMDAAVPMPYGGRGDPRDIAAAIAFLASTEARRITGQVLFVDGGADAVLRGDDVW